MKREPRVKFETKRCAFGRYLWVQGEPVGYIPASLSVTGATAAALLKIRRDWESSGFLAGEKSKAKEVARKIGVDIQ